MVTSVSGLLGGWLRGWTANSGIIGGWIAGVESGSLDATFYAYFNVAGRDKKEFDAQAILYRTGSASFDAQATLYIDEQIPLVQIRVPSTHQSGTTLPITYNFIADASGLNSKRIVYTSWFFSDVPITSGSIISSSGTFETSHTFSRSGLFDVIFIAVDSDGLINSDRRMINTASGTTLPVVSLTATTLSGVSPLQIGFSGIIVSAPNPIIDKFIYFGDGTFSSSTNNILKNYIINGNYVAVFRVIDREGLVATDSVVINGNN